MNTIYNTITTALTNLGVTTDKYESRINVCKNCSDYDGTRCKQCGCFMELKTKIKNARCPLNKW